jgi:hypothetical protein
VKALCPRYHFDVRRLLIELDCAADAHGVDVAWYDGTARQSDVIAGYNAHGFLVEACTELGELYIELILSPLVSKERS